MMHAFLLALTLWVPPQETQDSKAEEKSEKRHEVVVVTASRGEQPMLEAASLVTVVSARDLAESPALVLDEHLRKVPGFSLFRRSSSLVAHPTTQGVSLRGIGPSGAGRSLVLFDGIPLNDPFGGWVYWNRIPLLSLEAVEVVRGATSQLYGSSALGGTLQLIPRQPLEDTLEVRARLASPQSYDLDFFSSDVVGRGGFTLAGRLFDSEGYFVVDEAVRGQVDLPARLDFQTLFGRFFFKRFHAGINLFRESRGNGTRLQTNSSTIQLFETGFRGETWRLDFYSQWGLFQSSFSRILPDRSQEFLTARQRVPSLGLGSSFSFQIGDRGLVGADWRRASWEGQGQNLAGIFTQQKLPLHPKLDLWLGARLDWWENRHIQGTFNPKIGMVVRPLDWLTLRTSAYRGFRAPTLNELYRPFRVGNIETLGNEFLREEYLWGGETGADFHPSGSLLVRFNSFWNSLRDPVSNVTLSVSPRLILRRRQNLGRVTIRGIETETIFRPSPVWQLEAAYLYASTAVEGSGLRLPQVPLHQGSMGLGYKGPVTVTASGRWSTAQFEDDLNRLALGGYAVFEVMVRRSLSEHLELFLALENLMDRSYPVGRTPVETLGAPRFVHAGLQWRLGRNP